ncbi:unnamed protein product [Mytilus coruscus]|uniref:Uncharacterized protein n=1 Tax=Mytilus coruscus TaxID=42192 RepID=A0A6J8EFF9_MYTCO|nr:unnamed protein product [Mytilus coruscus]
MKNSRNKSSVYTEEPSKRFRKLAMHDHLKSKKHEAAKYSESLNRVSVPERNGSQSRGFNDLKYLSHRSAGSQLEIVVTIADTLKNSLIDKLQQLNCYGLTIDDLKDVSSLEQMITYRTFNILTQLLKLCKLISFALQIYYESANSETLFTALIENLESMKLDIKKVSGLCTDGASVMLGKKEGLGVRLKRKNSSLIATHCVCHRLVPACTDTN